MRCSLNRLCRIIISPTWVQIHNIRIFVIHLIHLPHFDFANRFSLSLSLSFCLFVVFYLCQYSSSTRTDSQTKRRKREWQFHSWIVQRDIHLADSRKENTQLTNKKTIETNGFKRNAALRGWWKRARFCVELDSYLWIVHVCSAWNSRAKRKRHPVNAVIQRQHQNKLEESGTS